MAAGDAIICWEALDPSDPALARARHLYETTQAAAERIPWAWIAGAVADRHAWRPGHWAPHLLLAAPRSAAEDAESVVGFAYGIHVPDYGGYVSYLGVDPQRRRQGAGTRLLRLMTCVLRVDAACEGVPLPFVVFESRRPDPGAGAAETNLWRARVALFARAGAWWVEGLTFFAPNFARRQGPPVPLQLFLIPIETPAAEFDGVALRDVAAGLLRKVYGRREGDPLSARTLPPGCRPALAPAAEALSDN